VGVDLAGGDDLLHRDELVRAVRAEGMDDLVVDARGRERSQLSERQTLSFVTNEDA
jgi:hypothetical protein